MIDMKEISKIRFRRALMWVALALIVSLIVLSIYGAFLGSYRAKTFFNSPVLCVYWLALMALLVAAVGVFRRLIRLPGLLMIHSGCVFVLACALWGSDAGLEIGNQLFGTDKIQKGRMIIFEGYTGDYVMLRDGEQIKELPFQIKLKDFRIEYYKPGYLEVITAKGRRKIPVEVGSVWPLGSDLGTIEIVKAFENFKISIEDGVKNVSDDPQAGYNPALEVRIKNADGAVSTRYVFERFPERAFSGEKFLLRYYRHIRDYISDVQVIKEGDVVAEKSIEVNRPLHFGGYHFYQSSYDTDAHKYTVLTVVSDTGLGFVYVGYVMLVIGVFWHFWLRHIFAKAKLRGE